jgi:AraC-like DNA-binding protein
MKKRLLVYDDNSQFVSSLDSAVGNKFDLSWIQNSANAIESIRSLKTDVIVINLSLNGESCIGVIKEAKKWAIPTIAVAPDSTEELAIRALNSGASYYIKDPIKLEEITNAVNMISGDPQLDIDPIERVRFYLLENYMNKIRVNDLCEAADISRQKLFYHFKKRYGKGIKSFLREIKMNKAKELLITSNLPVYKIAKAVGYNHFGYFCREFKKNFGITPSEMRKNGDS